MKLRTPLMILGLAMGVGFGSSVAPGCGSDSGSGGGTAGGGTAGGGTAGASTTTTTTTTTSPGTGGSTTTSQGTGGTGGSGGSTSGTGGTEDCGAEHPEGKTRATADVVNACACQDGTPCTGDGDACKNAADHTACTSMMFQDLSAACQQCVQTQADGETACALAGATGTDCQTDADCSAYVTCVISGGMP